MRKKTPIYFYARICMFHPSGSGNKNLMTIKGEDTAMKIQLSISLLASDRPAALERCLDSLRPLMMKVPSELIVIATGTDPRVRETAARYTDQVLPFTWCDDFSAARNAGLQAAEGEWFLYLDDDEWFEDTSEISDFFLTGEYRSYGTAFYRVRNYLDWDGIRYFDFHAFRMARITSGIAFQNPIHEELVPRRGEAKFFESYVHHYGYIVDKNKTGTGKTSRNIPILLQNIRRNPGYIKNYVQLTREYYVRREWEKAEEYCRKGRGLCRGKTGAEWYVQWFQVYWADIQGAKGDAWDARKAVLSILEKEKTSELARLCLYRKMILLCTKLEKHEDTLHYGRKFETLLAYTDGRPELWEQQGYGDINKDRIKNPEELALGRLRCAEAAFRLKDIVSTEDFLKLLPWEEETWIQRYYPLFDSWKSQDTQTFQELLKKLSIQNAYLLFQKTLCPGSNEGKEHRMADLLFCISHTQSPFLQQQILEEAAALELDLSGFAEVLDPGAWNGCAQQLISSLTLSQLSSMEKAAGTLKNTAPLQGLWLDKLIREKKLVRGYPAGEQLAEELSGYIWCVLSYYGKQYRQEMFEEKDGEFLPADCRFAVFVKKALGCMEEQQFTEAVSLLRSALKFYPAMTGVVQELIRQMKSRMDNPALNTGEEFQMLAVQMKQNLLSLAQAGQYDEALSVMEQLSALLPEDLELLRIRQSILRAAIGRKI